jgi:O-antigen/teichoic acid export membrane protein
MSAPEAATPEIPHPLDTPAAGGIAIRGTALRAIGFGVVTLIGLVSAPVLTRHLGVVDFGRYSTVLSLIAVVSVVTDAGLGALAVRELAVLPPAAHRALMRHLLGIRLLLTLIGLAAAITFAALVGYGERMVLGTVVCGMGAITYIAQGTLSLPLQAGLRLGVVTAAEVVRQVVLTVAIVALVLAGAGVVPLLAATIPAGLAGTLALAGTARGSLVLRPRYDAAAWRRILHATLPIAVGGAMYALYFRLVLLLMSVIASAMQTGWFALSFRVVEILVGVPFLVVGSLLPLFARAARDDQERLAFGFRRTFDVSVVAGVGLTLVTYTGAPLAMSILTGDASGGPVDVLRIQSLSLVAVFVNVCLGTVLIALRRHRALLAVNAIALGGIVVAALVLVPAAGARGGAAAAAAGEWLLALAYGLALLRARPDLRPSFSAFPKAAVAAAAAVLASRAVHVPYVPNVGTVAVASVVYVVVLWAVRGVPPELTIALLRRDRERIA